MENQLPSPQIQVVQNAQGVTIHTFVSPAAFISNATHIIETPTSCIVVDGQFIVPYAKQFRAYIDALGKPILRVYLSHEHPDHFFGVGAAFSDCEVYALAPTISFLKAQGQQIRDALAQQYGDFVTKTVLVPQHEITPGVEVVDGVTIEHVVIAHTETEFLLTLKLPELGVYIVQDVIYSGAHMYISDDLEHWIEVLNALKASEYELFLPGHGMPADKAEVQANIDYLEKAQDLLKKQLTPDQFKQALIEAFPNRTGEGIFDIYLPRLFNMQPTDS